MSNLEVAKTILEQLGGNKFAVMTGAKNFVGSEQGLMFKIGSNSKGVNKVRIVLTPMDLYDMEFYSVRGTSIKLKAEHKGVYCDQLQNIFVEATGLYTRLV